MKKTHTKILLWNTLFLAVFLAIIELFLGEWKSIVTNKHFKSPIPGLVKDVTLYYDARHLYKSDEAVKVKYVRDNYGYRSKEKDSDKKIVLTIGGSTTDQRYITEGETWQDYLDTRIPSYDFVNAGIDGQSTYGHLASIDAWHSTSLVDQIVATIIFYVGVNDTRLLEGRLNAYDKPSSTLGSIRQYISQYSFFYPRLKRVYRSISKNYSDVDGDKVMLAMHGGITKNFLDARDGNVFSGEFSTDYSSYKQLFSELMLKARQTFPNSSIVIIQQQAPGCRFTSKYSGIDIHPYEDSSGNICSKLASVYATQNEALNSLPSNQKLITLPMYLDRILGEQDLYDFIHTNPAGSKKIGMYIEKSRVFKE